MTPSAPRPLGQALPSNTRAVGLCRLGFRAVEKGW